MKRAILAAVVVSILVALTGPVDAFAQRRPRTVTRPANETLIWRDPGAVGQLDLEGGVGGRSGAPLAPFQFEEEDSGGTNPKIKVTDASGRRWGVKWGTEVKSEVFATRIAWAAGYFVEPAYFVARGRIDGIPSGGLDRARKFVATDGSFTDARFELREENVEKLKDEQSWAWNSNPFVGTKHLNGLKIVLMLVSNWDSKDRRDAGRGSNTGIYKYTLPGGNIETRYLFTDWGGSMGKWGNFFSREKWDCKGFASQSRNFIKGVKAGGIVEFGYSGQRTSDVAEGITARDVRFVYKFLGQLSDEQLRDGLRACGASDEEMVCYVNAMRERLNQMASVAATVDKQPAAKKHQRRVQRFSVRFARETIAGLP